MAIRNALLGLGMLLAALSLPATLASAATYDVLALPAAPTQMAHRAPLFVIKRFGDRFFAAGERGHIIFSDDQGQTWTQAEVPVRSTLLDIDFADADTGWAVGHEGVILGTTDGGKTWELQFDGLRYGQEGLVFYTKLAEENPDDELYDYLIGEMEFAIEQGADKPLFRVNAHNTEFVHAAGAYGMIMVTFDGGKHWEHRLHTVENESFFHLFDFSPLPEPGRFFISGEAGLFLIGDVNEQKATKVNSVPWEGSFFTSVDAADGAIVLGGLRGRMFRTDNAGDTWIVVEKPPTSAIVAAMRLQDDTLVAAGVGGEFLVSSDNGLSFSLDPASGTVGPVFDFAEGEDNSLLVAGPKGIKTVTLSR